MLVSVCLPRVQRKIGPIHMVKHPDEQPRAGAGGRRAPHHPLKAVGPGVLHDVETGAGRAHQGIRTSFAASAWANSSGVRLLRLTGVTRGPVAAHRAPLEALGAQTNRLQ